VSAQVRKCKHGGLLNTNPTPNSAGITFLVHVYIERFYQQSPLSHKRELGRSNRLTLLVLRHSLLFYLP
jgi:hypothetical protein